MLKFAVVYSKAWNAVKIAAKTIVNIKLQVASVLFPAVIAWWLYVIVAPDVNNINVFNNGTSNGLKTSIPLGGQIVPISMVGAKLAAKKAQKKAKKNMTSEAINKSIPYLRPNWTMFV
jgi:hypothetical protein